MCFCIAAKYRDIVYLEYSLLRTYPVLLLRVIWLSMSVNNNILSWWQYLETFFSYWECKVKFQSFKESHKVLIDWNYVMKRTFDDCSWTNQLNCSSTLLATSVLKLAQRTYSAFQDLWYFMFIARRVNISKLGPTFKKIHFSSLTSTTVGD